MTQTDAEILISKEPMDPSAVEAELEALAHRYRSARRHGVQLVSALGNQAEAAFARLPSHARAAVEKAIRQALLLSLRGALHSRRMWPVQPEGWSRMVTAGLGAAGGATGLPGALVELPLTTTVLLRSIQDVAVEHGFDPHSELVRFDVLEVFSSAGPLKHDDGVDTAFVSQRIGLAAGGLDAVISLVAPRLAVAFGPKVAAQLVPIIGAVAGSSVNFIYAGYYRDMAHVHFGLRKLALEADADHDAMRLRLANKLNDARR